MFCYLLLFSFSIQVHSNNMFSRDVKIFSSVSCWFKPHFVWEAEPVEFRTVLDDRNPSARYVTVDLNHRTAKSLRCRFYFADIWMMFSEISFQSGNKHTHVQTKVQNSKKGKISNFLVFVFQWTRYSWPRWHLLYPLRTPSQHLHRR